MRGVVVVSWANGAVDSTNSGALLALANIYRRTGRLDLALDTCEHAKKISPSAPQVRFEMAAIQIAQYVGF